MFEKKNKKDFRIQFVCHTQKLTLQAEENLFKLIAKEKKASPKKKIGKSYMINKLLEEL